jgi:protein-S-isoprenylcysteine O-methyltransferase Ste14
MRRWPAELIGALWLAWVLYWIAAAAGAKAAREREPLASRAAFILAMAVSILLLGIRHWPGWLGRTVVPGGWVGYWCAVALVIAGLAFSVWARALLGRNWSGTVTIKVDHELIQAGPYRKIRHPIYTGILLAVLGTGLAAGQLRGLLAFVITFGALWFKSRVEESWMEREFGERYTAYRRTSWALVPFVL